MPLGNVPPVFDEPKPDSEISAEVGSTLVVSDQQKGSGLPPVDLEDFAGVREPSRWEELRTNPFFWIALALGALNFLSNIDGVWDLLTRL